MEALGAVFNWIGSHEAVLSGIAASIVILGVLYAPVRRLLRSGGREAQDERVASTAPSGGPPAQPLVTDRPSVAVLPFANLSGDPEQEFLADGLTEDIILGLSRMKQLFVIARNSCFTYKGRVVDAQQVSRELGVRYVLEGSVRRMGDRIRVTAQLVDATTRTPRWAERFDRRLEEILEVDDEVTAAIVGALQPALRRAEAEQARRAPPEDLTTWALVNGASVAIQSDLGDRAAAQRAVRACDEALARDPDYAFAHAVRAHAASLLVHQPEPEEAGADAENSIRRALELEPDDPLVHHCHAAVLGNLGRTDEAIRSWERAIELDPNSAAARAGLGIARIFKREAHLALELIDGALRHSPRDPLVYHWLGHRALALILTGRFAEAAEASRASLARRPSRLAYAVLAAALAHEGAAEEAREAWRELVARFPGLVADDFARMAAGLAPDERRGQAVAAALRRAAGVDEAGGLGASPPSED